MSPNNKTPVTNMQKIHLRRSLVILGIRWLELWVVVKNDVWVQLLRWLVDHKWCLGFKWKLLRMNRWVSTQVWGRLISRRGYRSTRLTRWSGNMDFDVVGYTNVASHWCCDVIVGPLDMMLFWGLSWWSLFCTQNCGFGMMRRNKTDHLVNSYIRVVYDSMYVFMISLIYRFYV